MSINVKKELLSLTDNRVKEMNALADEAKKLINSKPEEEIAALEKIGFAFKEKKKHITDEHSISAMLIRQDSLVHIDDIKKLALKYDLRFLRPDQYKGNIPITTGAKLLRFQEANPTRGEFKLLAPSEMFELKDLPITYDPLLLCFIGDGFWQVIDKWGNDFTSSRRLRAIWKSMGENLDFGLIPTGCFTFISIVGSLACACICIGMSITIDDFAIVKYTAPGALLSLVYFRIVLKAIHNANATTGYSKKWDYQYK